jgi:predicted ABC-class ATPase
MHDQRDLRAALRWIDGKSYPAYKDIRGAYAWPDYLLTINHVQGDPFAAPSRVMVRVPLANAGFPAELRKNRIREIALRDFCARRFADAAARQGRGRRGSGKSGLIAIEQPGQEILERTSVVLTPDAVEARFVMGLPAHGRRIAGKEAESMFFDDLPEIVGSSLFFDGIDASACEAHCAAAEDADTLREMLSGLGIVAFVADGAVLPRASGVDDRPLQGPGTVPFATPSSLSTTVTLPNRGEITGMGVPEGITLIVGGGFHGKSTLLRALERGIYNHIPGDGRECVVTHCDAVKIRAEDGRSVECVDITPFIGTLPFQRPAREFRSANASGSTSQAANIIEALEADAGTLLIDEDTSATNFMIRDHRMQELVSKDREPITPFIDKAGQLLDEYGVSTVLVIGGSGDYFDIATTVICMHAYLPEDCTERARAIAARYAAERQPEGGAAFGRVTSRIPVSGSFDASRGKRRVKITVRGIQTIEFGTTRIDLSAVEQLVDRAQTAAIGDALRYATRYMDGRPLADVIRAVMEDIRTSGLDVIGTGPQGTYAAFRPYEFAAAVNRTRTLEMHQKKD